ncbi:PHP-associated domain-containing protein [Lentisphaerota bacterium WC36G]|nr:PHP domain-containing protein [Lentisphaerae bacterium WC36]
MIEQNNGKKIYKCDFHIHVKGDPKDCDLKYTIKELILEAEKQNFDILAITNHNQIFDISRYNRFAKAHNILLIPGVEINLGRNHVVILFAQKSALQIKTFADLAKYRKNHPKSIIIAPHPFYKAPSCLGRHLENNIDLFDSIEYCHFHMKLFNFPNLKAVRLAKKHHKTIVGSSDVHKIKFFGTTYTLLEMKKFTTEEIHKSLRNISKVNYKSSQLPFFTAIYYISKSVFFYILQHIFRIK